MFERKSFEYTLKVIKLLENRFKEVNYEIGLSFYIA